MRVGSSDLSYCKHWQKWFAWRPVTLNNGTCVWWGTVYRRATNTYVNYDDWTEYEFTDIFGVISSEI